MSCGDLVTMTIEPSRSAVYRDRLAGGSVRVPEGVGTMVGRWVLESAEAGVFVNSAPTSRGDFLVPDLTGSWRVVSESGQNFAGSVTRAQLPDELEASSVRSIGDKLADLERAGASWQAWVGVAPLVPGISDEVDLLELERATRLNLGHIETICRRPRAHLHVEVERVPVSRARRIPASAATFLASHTADWDGRLIRGIRPKRVLAEVRLDELDIYENRVAARLIDHLVAHMHRRIRVLRRLLKVFQEKEDYSATLQGSTYQRTRRMSALWGETVNASEGRRKAEASLQELQELSHKLAGLMGSALYGGVPRRAFVPTTLRSTNILVNDAHYRRVADVWRTWASTGEGDLLSPVQLHAEAQRLCRGMDAFAMLLMLRALASLEYAPDDVADAQTVRRGVDLALRHGDHEIELQWCDDGTLVVRCRARVLRIVALPTNLTGGTDDQIGRALEQIRHASVARTGEELLVLYLASEGDGEAANAMLLGSLHTVGNDPRIDLRGAGCLPVSPWEIGSTERVARALRWFVTRAQFNDYPTQITVPPTAKGIFDSGRHAPWLVGAQSGTLELRIPPRDHEWERLGLTAAVEAAERAAAAARDEHARLTETLRRAVREKRTGNLVHEKHDANANVTERETFLHAVRGVAAQLQLAREHSAELLVCPSCGVSADPTRDFEPRDRGCFRCACMDCGTEWAMRRCSRGHRYATMLPNGEFLEPRDTFTGWEDRTYGSDILAVPARTGDGGWGFVCPECGVVN